MNNKYSPTAWRRENIDPKNHRFWSLDLDDLVCYHFSRDDANYNIETLISPMLLVTSIEFISDFSKNCYLLFFDYEKMRLKLLIL